MSSRAFHATCTHPTEVAAAWAQIEATVRRSSELRCEDRPEEATALLRGRLPRLVRAWSKGCGQTPDACRARLRGLLVESQAQVAEALFTRRLVLASNGVRRTEALLDAKVDLRRRVPVEEIVRMVDHSRRPRRVAAGNRARRNFAATHRRGFAGGVAA